MAMGNLSGHTGGGGDDGEDEGAGIFADINITPLTDVFLVMVIIFMVSALAVQAMMGMGAATPRVFSSALIAIESS